jgi:hypothetical protein
VAGWLELKVALQESSLPILVEVHDWAHLPATFHRNIEQCYVVLQPGCASESVDVPVAGRAGA